MRTHTLRKIYLFGVCFPVGDLWRLVCASDAALSPSVVSLSIISIA